MRGVKAIYRGCGFGPSVGFAWARCPLLADTIEAALVRAYQNNPQLNAQRAQVRITDENVPQALSGYRPKVAVTASAGYQYTDTLSTAGRRRQHGSCRPIFTAPIRRAASAPPSRRRCSTASRPPTGPERRRARFPARAKRLRVLEQTVLLVGRHDLHGLSARFRDRRGAEEQRSRARADAETDARPLQCRRSHAHRRRAVGGAARRRQDAAADRGSQSDHDALELPPHHRQRAAKRLRRARRSIASCRRRCRPPSNSA